MLAPAAPTGTRVLGEPFKDTGKDLLVFLLPLCHAFGGKEPGARPWPCLSQLCDLGYIPVRLSAIGGLICKLEKIVVLMFLRHR